MVGLDFSTIRYRGFEGFKNPFKKYNVYYHIVYYLGYELAFRGQLKAVTFC